VKPVNLTVGAGWCVGIGGYSHSRRQEVVKPGPQESVLDVCCEVDGGCR
jgi:hypothetical protein